MRHRTSQWQQAAKAERYGRALIKLRAVYSAWAKEEAEAVDVIEAVAEFLETTA